MSVDGWPRGARELPNLSLQDVRQLARLYFERGTCVGLVLTS